MPPTEYLPTRKRLALMLLGALAFVTLTPAMAVAQPTVLTVLVAAAAVPFFGWCGVLAFISLVRRGPELTVTDEGFDHRQLGHVAWHEVKALLPAHFSAGRTTQRFVEVVLHDPQTYLARRPKASRMVVRSNMSMGFSPILISANTLSNPIGEVLAEMRRRHERFLAAAEASPTSD